MPGLSEASPAPRSSRARRPWSPTGSRGDRPIAGRSRRSAGVHSTTAVLRAATAVRPAGSRSRSGRGTGSDRAADGAGRAEGPGHPHRRRVPGAEGEDPGLLGTTVHDVVPVPATPDVDAVRPPAQPHPAGRLQPAAAGEVQVDSPSRRRRYRRGTRPVADLKELGELHQSGVLTDAEFEAAKAKLLADDVNKARATTLVRACAPGSRRPGGAAAVFTDDVRAWTPALSSTSLSELIESSIAATRRSRTSSWTSAARRRRRLRLRRVDRRDDAQRPDRARRRPEHRADRHRVTLHGVTVAEFRANGSVPCGSTGTSSPCSSSSASCGRRYSSVLAAGGSERPTRSVRTRSRSRHRSRSRSSG